MGIEEMGSRLSGMTPFIIIYVVGGYGRIVLMTTHNICFQRQIRKTYPIVIKYTPYLFSRIGTQTRSADSFLSVKYYCNFKKIC